tara:strand:- start:531 stop:1469 length:939 start_codon:yes stop_codon:yes gene_type:complete
MPLRNTVRTFIKRSDISQIATNKTNITTNTSEIAAVGATDVEQSAHGFAVLDAIRHNGSNWVKAQADADGNVATHVVTEVGPAGRLASDNFSYASSGTFTKTGHGLSLAQRYLSASSAGALVTSAPAIAQPILRPVDANTVAINVQRATTSSAADARTVYTKSFKLSHSELAAKGGVTTSDFTLATLGPYEGVRWVWFRTTTAWVGCNVFINMSFTGGSNAGLLYAQQNVTAAGNYDDNDDHAGTGWDGLGNSREMGDAGAEYDATTLMGLEKELKIYTQTTSGNHDAASAGVTYINVEIVRYDPTQATTVS